MKRISILLTGFLSVLSPASAQSDPVSIAPGHGLSGNANFGASVGFADGVGVSGQPTQIIVAGAPGQLVGGAERGAVTVAVWDGAAWQSTALLAPNSVTPGGRFGQSIAISRKGGVLVVGAPANSFGVPASGSVYVYAWDGVVHSQPTYSLIHEWHGIFESGAFGQAVATTSDYVAVGEPGALFGAGVVNVFGAASATVYATFVGESPFDLFGGAVELARFGSRTDLYVGAPFHDGVSTDAGRVYRFSDEGGWSFVTQRDGTQFEEHYGVSLDARGNELLVGSPEFDSGSAPDSGRVERLFIDGLMIAVGNLEGVSAGERLGASTAFTAHPSTYASVLGGAPNAAPAGLDSGLVRAGQANGGPPITSWTSPGADSGILHGFALATPEGFLGTLPRVVVGAPMDATSVPAGGAVTLYMLEAPTSATDLGAGLPGSFGITPQLAGQSAFEAGAQLSLELIQSLPNATYLLIAGFSAVDLPFLGGTLTPSADVLLPIATDPSGSGALDLILPPGATGYSLWMQAWGVDPGGLHGAASSNAITFDVD